MALVLKAPTFHVLSPRTCSAILARNHVGRLAFAHHNRVDIRPLHYAYVDGWIYGRTSPGAKSAALEHNQWVAFEVDEIAELFKWQSVVVHGSWYDMRLAPLRERPGWGAGLAQLGALVPGTLTADDPVPHRTIVFRINTATITGRSCRPAPRTHQSGNLRHNSRTPLAPRRGANR
jgi:hypothetical protein